MNAPLEQQLSAYGDHLAATMRTIELDEVVAEKPIGDLSVRPLRPVRPVRRAPGWVYGIATAVAVLAVISGATWLTRAGGDASPAADTTPSTTAPPPTTSPTAVVDATPTTVVDAPTGPSTGQVEEETAGDSEVVLAMMRSFPLNGDPDSVGADGPDPSIGQTAGTTTVVTLDNPIQPNDDGFIVSFKAFERADQASQYLADQLIVSPNVIDGVQGVFPLSGVGDEAVGTFGEYRGRAGGDYVEAAVRRGRFVEYIRFRVDSDDEVRADEERAFAIEQATSIAGIADETMQSVLSSGVRPLAATPEILTSYRMTISFLALTVDIEEIVTPDGSACTLSGWNEDLQGQIVIANGEAWERPDSSAEWVRSEPDSPMFDSAQALCRAWSPILEDSFLADLLEPSDGHASVEKGRPTTTYWFTPEDLVEAGLWASTDQVTFEEFVITVDDAGPWLASLSMLVDGDSGAFSELFDLVRMHPPGFESSDMFAFHIEIDSFNDTPTLLDELDAMILPGS